MSQSKNATFLFYRDFMDYHQDRFLDYSFMIYKNDVLVAIFPANKKEMDLYSHQGLTYGGLIFRNATELDEKKALYLYLLKFLEAETVKSLTIKPMPEFYSSENSEVFNYASIENRISIVKKNRVLAIDYHSEFKIHKTKVKRFKKMQSSGFQIKESVSEFEVFWTIVLIPRLLEKHNSNPVHSLSEIKALKKQFQHHIFQYNIYDQEEILAGITIFKKGQVVKSQYGIASEQGEKSYALDMLFVYLIQKYRDEGMHYFSMGTVNDDSHLGYSKGMLKQKQEFGCKTYVQEILKLHIND